MFNAKKFSKVLKQNKITSIKLSEILKENNIPLKKDAIDSYRKGNVKNPNIEALQCVAELCNVTIVDFFNNEKDIKEKITFRELDESIDKYIEKFPTPLMSPNIKTIPVTKGYPTANKSLQENSMNFATNIYIDKRLVKTGYAEKELKAVVMIGDSMSPYLEPDDIAIYHPLDEPIGDDRYVINTPHGLTVKKLKFLLNGTIQVISENPQYNTAGTYDEQFDSSNLDTLEILGLVVGRILKS